MWFHPLPLVLYGVLVLAALVSAEHRVAVAFTDVKFDDKVAIWSLLLMKRYDMVVAITSGIKEHYKAAQELREYLHRQNDLGVGNFIHLDRLMILQGDNIGTDPAPHEEWWKNLDGTWTLEANEGFLRNLLKGRRVNIFQIAPASNELVEAVINAADANSIDVYMLLHGYNSKQVDKQAERTFLQSLQEKVLTKDPTAKVVFTSSFQSYEDPDGGGKQLKANLEGMFPWKDVMQAVRDPFWRHQLRKGASKLGMPEIPYTDEELDNAVYAARMQRNEGWRRYLANYVRTAIQQNSHLQDQSKVLDRYQRTLLPEFTGTQPVTIEFADAGHIAAWHRYLDSARLGKASGMQLWPIKFVDGSSNDPDAKVELAMGTRRNYHGYLLKGADRNADLQWIKDLAGIRI